MGARHIGTASDPTEIENPKITPPTDVPVLKAGRVGSSSNPILPPRHRVPRTCGDDPHDMQDYQPLGRCPSRMRGMIPRSKTSCASVSSVPRTCGDDCICQSISRIACTLATLIRISVANVKISYIYLDRCCLREFLRWIIISAISIYMNP